ncbi:MAG: cytochrome b [Gammaproteobacteria bacterium]|nr:cytochrome b [Gammaproteobacteria bacterium]
MPTQYNRIAVLLHWLSAILIFVLLFSGSQLLEPVPNSDPGKIGVLQGHATLGVLTGILVLVRLINLKMRGKPADASPAGTFRARAASIGHKLLYILVLAVVGSGMGIAQNIDLQAVIAGEAMLPEYFEHSGARGLHGILTKLLALTILGHIVAALHHQFVLKDGLLTRMRWKRMD